MNAKPVGGQDPVVAEVRRIRADPWRQGGGTVASLLRLLGTREAWKTRPLARSRRRARPHPHSGNTFTL